MTPTPRLPVDSKQATLRPPLLYQVLATTAYFLLTPVGSAQTHPLPPRRTNAHPKSRPQLGAQGTWSLGPGSSVSITSALHNSGFRKGPGAAAQAPRRVGTPTWPGSRGFAPLAVYLYPVCNQPGRRERGTRRARRGMTDGKGGCSGSRKAVTSGAFPDNRESVPCNTDREPEGQWNIPLHTGSWGGSRRRSDPFNRKGRRNSKSWVYKGFRRVGCTQPPRDATSPP